MCAMNQMRITGRVEDMIRVQRKAIMYPSLVYVPRREFFSLNSKVQFFSQSHRLKRKVNAPASLMFDIVSDVSKYAEFVPFVEESFVNKKDNKGLPLEAGLRVGWNQFNEKFTCKLSCEAGKKVIAESLTLDLFKELQTEWNFQDLKNPLTKSSFCEVDLLLTFEFKNPLYNSISSLFCDQVSTIMIKAFEERAKQMLIEQKKN